MDLKAWLNEFKSLSKSEIKTYAKKYENIEFINTIYTLVEKGFESNEIRPIVIILKSFISSGESALVNFVMITIPQLIAFYLRPGNEEFRADLESLFLNFVNFEPQHSRIMHLPTLQQSSIYHDLAELGENSVSLNEKLPGHNIQYVSRHETFVSINAENRSNVIAAMLEKVYHVEIAKLYRKISKELIFILKSPISNEDCVISLARIGGLYNNESPKLLNLCHDIAEDNIYFRAMFVTNALRNLCPNIYNGASDDIPGEKSGMKRAVTSKSIRHHQWARSTENLDDELAKSQTVEENLTAIIEVEDEITRRKTSTQVASPGSKREIDTSIHESQPLLS